MLGYLSADIICSEKRTVFRERSSRKTVCYEEQIMSKDKYPSIFSPQMETIVFIILQIFFAKRIGLKIGKYSRIFPSFSWGTFGHVTRLDQSRASEKIWWIIRSNMEMSNNPTKYDGTHKLNNTCVQSTWAKQERRTLAISNFMPIPHISCSIFFLLT